MAVPSPRSGHRPSLLSAITHSARGAFAISVHSLIVLMDNGKFVQAIQPAASAQQLALDDYSIKVHLELTMLLALGLLNEKPRWVDERPVLPRQRIIESLLVASTRRKPRTIARRTAAGACTGTHSSAGCPVWKSATWRTPFTSQHVNTLTSGTSQVHQAAIAEQRTAEAISHNAMVGARQRAMMDEALQRNPKPGAFANVPSPPIKLPTIPLPSPTGSPLSLNGQAPGVWNGVPQLPVAGPIEPLCRHFPLAQNRLQA